MNEEEIIRYDFLRDWVSSATKEEIVEKLIQNDDRAKQIKKLEEVIDMMAEEIWRCNAIDCDFKHFKDNICKDEQDTGNKQICKECIKQYFFKKAGERS